MNNIISKILKLKNLAFRKIQEIKEFTFFADGGNVPKVTINGEKIGVVNCTYVYSTATDKTLGSKTVIVEGFVNDEHVVRSFEFDFISKNVFELTPLKEEIETVSISAKSKILMPLKNDTMDNPYGKYLLKFANNHNMSILEAAKHPMCKARLEYFNKGE